MFGIPDNNSNGAGVENWNGYTLGGQVTEIIEHVLHTICPMDYSSLPL